MGTNGQQQQKSQQQQQPLQQQLDQQYRHPNQHHHQHAQPGTHGHTQQVPLQPSQPPHQQQQQDRNTSVEASSVAVAGRSTAAPLPRLAGERAEVHHVVLEVEFSQLDGGKRLRLWNEYKVGPGQSVPHPHRRRSSLVVVSL
ncbi:MAG: hypothetical protein WDW38_003312 [Sanguina aurantia]